MIQAQTVPVYQDGNEPDLDLKTNQVDGTLQDLCPPICSIEQAISSAALNHNVSYQRLLCLARRESTFNPNASSNPPYMGLMQFDQPTWNLTPYSSYSPYNAWASANAAAYLISRGGGSRWPVWSQC